MTIVVAFLAGALATVNPCGFAMLPAFLALYVGAREEHLPHASTRALQGILVGLMVTSGFLLVFLAAGVPIALGAARIARGVPWAGLAIGVAMGAVAVMTLAGKRLEFTIRGPRTSTQRRPRAMLLFGVAYGLASVGCTLPIFLVVMGASLTAGGVLATLAVVGAYALGMAAVLMALAVSAALLRDGVARVLRRLLPHLRWITGGLLLVVSGYLIYYWGSLLFLPAGARSQAPILGAVERLAAAVQGWAQSDQAQWFLIGAVAVVGTALVFALREWGRRTP